MKILTVNAGSSSLKFNLISLPEEKELVSGYFEKIGLNGGIYSLKINGSKIQKEAEMKDHKVAIELLIKELLENNIIKSLDEIDGIGKIKNARPGRERRAGVLLTVGEDARAVSHVMALQSHAAPEYAGQRGSVPSDKLYYNILP